MASSELVRNGDARVLAPLSSNSAKKNMLCSLRQPFISKKLYVLIFVRTNASLFNVLLPEKARGGTVKCDDEAVICGPSYNINLHVSFFFSNPYTKRVHLKDRQAKLKYRRSICLP